MKAQATIEFLISTLVFLIAISFIIFTIYGNYPIFRQENVKNVLLSKSFQITQILLTSAGSPRDWDMSNVETIGLSTGLPYILDSRKISELNCSETEYEKVREIFGLQKHDLIINITDENGITISTCAPPAISLVRPKYWFERFAIMFDGSTKIVRISVTVY